MICQTVCPYRQTFIVGLTFDLRVVKSIYKLFNVRPYNLNIVLLSQHFADAYRNNIKTDRKKMRLGPYF